MEPKRMSAGFHRLRRAHFKNLNAPSTYMDDQSTREEEQEREPSHPADRKARGQGRRKYPEKKRRKVKPLTDEQKMHEERKRIFTARLLWGAKRLKKED